MGFDAAKLRAIERPMLCAALGRRRDDASAVACSAFSNKHRGRYRTAKVTPLAREPNVERSRMIE
jgi:hypothetical protein